MTALVTGATGFLGRHVTDLLIERGERPRVLIRPGDDPAALADADVGLYWGDITDRRALDVALEGVDRVVHCAARTGPWGHQRDYELVNVHGLETLVRAALDAGVRRLVHVSSITVHGNDVRGAADEDAPLREEPNPYSRSKVLGERLLDRMIREEGAPVTIVRPGWIYGPGDHASFGRLARMIENGRMSIVGRGDNHLPLIYVRDAAKGVLLASEAEHVEGRSYLLVNDEPVTQREFLTAIAGELDAPVPGRHVPYRLVLGIGASAETVWRLTRRREPPPVMRYGIQLLGGENRFIVRRARHELGFEPEVDLAEGVQRAVAWFRGDGAAAHAAEVAA